MQAEPGQILEGNLSGKLPGCSPARAVCVVPAPGPGWGSGDTAAPMGIWDSGYLPTHVVLPRAPCHGETPAATQAGAQGPKLAAVNGARELASLGTRKLTGSWAPSHCDRGSTRQTSCPSRMSAQAAHVTFPIWDEAAGNPRQPRTGPEPSPAVTCMQKVQRAQSWARADPASLGRHSPSEDTGLPAHGCLSSSSRDCCASKGISQGHTQKLKHRAAHSGSQAHCGCLRLLSPAQIPPSTAVSPTPSQPLIPWGPGRTRRRDHRSSRRAGWHSGCLRVAGWPERG